MNYLQVLYIITIAVSIDTGAAANVNRDNDLDNHLDSKGPPAPNTMQNFIKYAKISPSTEHEDGTTVALSCEAMTSPAPTIRWLKNNLPIKEYNIESNMIQELTETSLARVESTLLISRPSSNLEDKYTCIITSGPSVKHVSSTISAADSNMEPSAYQHHLAPAIPNIIYTYKVFMDNIGSNVVIPCKSIGHPHPHVTWIDTDGHMILKRNRRMKVLRTGELIIRNLRWADMGNYQCNAYNYVGNVSSITFIYPLKPE